MKYLGYVIAIILLTLIVGMMIYLDKSGLGWVLLVDFLICEMLYYKMD